MGNCMVVQQDKVVQVMKTDGKILEYKAPIQVHQVLTEFSGHAVSPSSPSLRHLHPTTKLLAGRLYYLVDSPPSPKSPKKKVRFADPQVQESSHHDHDETDQSSVVRVKLVISKQQLQDMLQKGGISVNSILSLVQTEKVIQSADLCDERDDGFERWKPALESIPEVI